MAKFNPEWEIVYLLSSNSYNYCVIKKPEPLPGEKTLMVREGCTVLQDGRWFYWKLLKPTDYAKWRIKEGWDDRYQNTPDFVVANRLNGGAPGKIPAPMFKARMDNNWIDGNPLVIPNYVSVEMLGDLSLAHLQLCDELQEGKPLLQPASAS